MDLAICNRIQLFMALAAAACSFSVQAGYDYAIIDPPGSVFNEVFGINNSGHVVGDNAFADGSGGAFVYDLKKGSFTFLPSVPGAFTGVIGINEPGVMVGIATDMTTFNDSAFILDKKGRFTLFSYPGMDNTDARAIDNTGRVTGYAFQNGSADFAAFIYDPGHGTFVDIRIPNSIFITPQGINGRGEVVGAVNFGPEGACAGCPAGQYGFLRGSSGTITLFRVNSEDNRTRARGITDSGLIAGSFATPGNGEQGFVASVAATGGFRVLSVAATDLVSVPGSVETIPQGIDNSGRVVGIVNYADFDLHGFVATPNGK